MSAFCLLRSTKHYEARLITGAPRSCSVTNRRLERCDLGFGARSRAGQSGGSSGRTGRQALEEITVTGSRIQRRDFSANAPITTIDESAFQATSTIGVETILNQLPQFIPAVTQFTTGDVQQTANNTVGGSFVSLRGLGPNRNLVLIDGKRAQPTNASMFVDTNMIPAAAIQRVELITGGASAVYGADAVGGVVNFILKDDFEGASIETRVGDTEHGGNQEILISGLLGVNGADGRGNVMLGLEHATRSKIEQWERDYRVADMANPATAADRVLLGQRSVDRQHGPRLWARICLQPRCLQRG